MQIENLITEHIDTWTSAVKKKNATGRGSSKKIELYGIKKLRELILELAVRGKLVPQDENDEPASVLLERIAEEKVELLNNKEIKKIRSFPSIDLDGLPNNWSCERLGNIFHIVYGKGLPNSKLTESGYKVFGANGIIGFYSEYLYEERQLLVSCRGAYSGKPNISPDFCFVTSNSLVLNNSWKNVSMEYFYYALSIADKSNIVTGSAQPQVTTTNLEPFIVLVPPLNEQHRIVAKVDELMLLCDQLEQQTESSIDAHKTLVEVLLNTLTDAKDTDELQTNWTRVSEFFDTLFTTEHSIDQLKETILQLAVMGKLVPQDPNDEPASKLLARIAEEKAKLIADKKIKRQKALPSITSEEKPFELPSGWEWEKCQNICFKITDGEHATPERTESGYYLLSARNVTNEGILLHDVDYVPEHEFKRIRNRCDPNIGDILISCSGSVGRVALVDKDNAYSMVRSVAMVRPCVNNLSPLYLALMLKSPYLQKQMKSRSKQSAQANLFLGAISNLVAIVPPLKEQNRIVSKVDKMFLLCDQLKSQLNQAQQTQLNLTDALVAQAV